MPLRDGAPNYRVTELGTPGAVGRHIRLRPPRNVCAMTLGDDQSETSTVATADWSPPTITAHTRLSESTVPD